MSRRLSPAERMGEILGPSGPEITCEECFDLLDQYVELERHAGAAEATFPGMRAHLQGCSACAEDYESLRDLVAKEKR